MNHNMGKSPVPVLMVICSAVLWGTYGSFVTLITRLGMDRNAQMFLRFLMTVIPTGIFMALRDRSLFRIQAKDLGLFFANAVFSLFFFSACYAAAIIRTKIAEAAALLYTAPVIVMLLSALLFGERITAGRVLCVLLSAAGCAFASGLAEAVSSGGAADGIGILLGLGAGLGYALYSIFSRMILNRGYSVYTNIFYSFLIVTLMFGAASIRDGTAVQAVTRPAAAAAAAACGIVTGFGAYLLYTLGMEKMETSRAAQLATVEPVTAAILGSVLFRQSLSGYEIAGILMVVISVIPLSSPSMYHRDTQPGPAA